MTQVLLKEHVSTYEIVAKGHATGSTEVCAAVSMLMTAVANWNQIYGSGDLLPSELKPGYARVKLRKADEGAKAIWELVNVAFHALAESDKNFLKKVQKLGQES